MESSKRSLFSVISKSFGILYCHVFFVSFGRWLPGPSSLEAGVF